MSTMEAPAQFDLAALRRGIEERDADQLIGLYAEDAEMRLVDRLHPPSNPQILRGRGAIGEYLNDICSRDMTHKVEHLTAAGDRVAYTEDCEYPGGSRVLCAATLDIADGHIVREVGVQVWDE
ncbi:nuclear transport factor 2 family protein [Nocardia seriolae]|nr:nuclear transport factor 2 family protein [Nocardia seriolae]MTJ65362.1 nuclear transport factor 2 family protein [Nocardia seriolae]MTJ71871.1 nuclear transport factor 2 family protein [Nocardia seriolae]MTJ90248.1 nuclear transport factor 2 family protein [Nocardia seriolae]MTK34211.1 nuclear transport factor 2 family protein [Nocardia seriolae]MTK43347.1 nuclear transport factor 2 family protein [Nocardia seriolae]